MRVQHGLRLAQRAVARQASLPPALLTKWQDFVVAKHAQGRILTADETQWIKNEVRWAFDHFQHVLPSDDDQHRHCLFSEACQRLSKGEPLAYVLGSQPFGDLPFHLLLRPPVLIPRPETEQWVLKLADHLAEVVDHRTSQPLDVRILDLCTGSGCIAIQLSHRLHQLQSNHPGLRWKVLGLDISPIAVDVARENASRLGALARNASLEIRRADLFSDTDMARAFELIFQNDVLIDDATQSSPSVPPLCLIVSNPPYIRPDAYRDQLDSSVRDWEDFRALVGIRPSTRESSATRSPDGDDEAGLAFYRRIRTLVECLPHMAVKGQALPKLVLEIGQGQAEAVVHMFSELPQTTRTQIQVYKDAWGVQRTVEIH